MQPERLLEVMNEDSLRVHLVDHAYFSPVSIKDWMKEKSQIDALPGCRVRTIYIDGKLAGWCGIQPDNNGYEIAIVISNKFWGNGILVFRTLLGWAKEFGHKEVLFHLLETRPEYKSLNRIAARIEKTELLGRIFTTYHISLDS